MDMKKKLEDAYKPDQQGRKEKVVIGLSGGLDSMITAYLLKIQKYDLIAVTVFNSWEDFSGDQRKILSCSMSSARLDSIRDFCYKLGIPHHTLKLTSDFKELVIEPWLNSKILGRYSDPCWQCHDVRMSALYHKMRELGALKLATGHFAKLFHQEATHDVYVHTSNDEEHDQSALLSRLPHDILSCLLLPLSDLTKKEVLKLGENFGIDPSQRLIEMHHCLPNSPELNELVVSKVPPKLIAGGPVMDPEAKENYGEHTGIHTHVLGETFEYRERGKPVKGVFGAFAFSEKRMVIYPEDFFLRETFLLTGCVLSEGVSMQEPIRAYAQLMDGQGSDCWIYPKSLSTVLVELGNGLKVLPGQSCTLIRKKGRNSKVYLTGEVKFLPPEEKKEEGEKSVPKTDYALDF